MALLSLKAFNELHMSSNLQHEFEAQIKIWLFFSRTHWLIPMDHVLNIVRTLGGGCLWIVSQVADLNPVASQGLQG